MTAVFGRVFLPVLRNFAIATPSMTRQHDRDAVSRRHSQQLLDLIVRGRRGSRGAWRNRHADLEEHLLQTSRSDRDQHLRRFVAVVLERVRSADRHVGEHPGAGDEPLVANEKGDLAFEDVETSLFTAVDMRWGTTAGSDDGLKQSILAVRVLPGRQEAVHVADNGDRSALCGNSQRWLAAHGTFLTNNHRLPQGPCMTHHIGGYPRWRRSKPIWPACSISWWAHHKSASSFVLANGCGCGTGRSSSASSRPGSSRSTCSCTRSSTARRSAGEYAEAGCGTEFAPNKRLNSAEKSAASSGRSPRMRQSA